MYGMRAPHLARLSDSWQLTVAESTCTSFSRWIRPSHVNFQTEVGNEEHEVSYKITCRPESFRELL